MNSMLQDLRFALRQLRRTPAFAITAILTLALGIGANTAIFSLLDQALLRSLPVRDPQQLVILEGTGDAWNGSISINGGDIAAYFSYPMYKDLRDRAQAFDGLITTGGADIGITRNGVSQLSKAEIVSGNYFTMLGVQPALGRVFTQSDDLQKDANPVAVLSFDYWKTRMGSDPRVVGTNLSINGHPFQIVGVAAPGFRSAVWGETPGVFVPMAMVDQIIPRRVKSLIDHTDRWVNILGRLKPGESRATAQASLAPLWHGLRAEELKALKVSSKHFTDGYLTNSRLNLLPGASGFSYQRDDFQKPLLAIMAMALLVLLIASVNVASLLLVRSAGRVREFSLRYALGAGASRILQQLLLEGILIGIGGGLAGMAIAPLALGALVRQLAGDHSSVAFTSSIDSRLLLFNFAVALGVSILFSLAPALPTRSHLRHGPAHRHQFGLHAQPAPRHRRPPDRPQRVAPHRRGPLRPHHAEPPPRQHRLYHLPPRHLRHRSAVRGLRGRGHPRASPARPRYPRRPPRRPGRRRDERPRARRQH